MPCRSFAYWKHIVHSWYLLEGSSAIAFNCFSNCYVTDNVLYPRMLCNGFYFFFYFKLIGFWEEDGFLFVLFVRVGFLFVFRMLILGNLLCCNNFFYLVWNFFSKVIWLEISCNYQGTWLWISNRVAFWYKYDSSDFSW